MVILVLTLQMLLAVVFIAAAVGKFRDIPGFAAYLTAAGVPKVLVQSLAIGIPSIEVVLAVSLFFSANEFLTYTFGMCFVLLIVLQSGLFLIALSIKNESCNCFGIIKSESFRNTVVRNLILITIALCGSISTVYSESILSELSFPLRLVFFTVFSFFFVVFSTGRFQTTRDLQNISRTSFDKNGNPYTSVTSRRTILRAAALSIGALILGARPSITTRVPF